MVDYLEWLGCAAGLLGAGLVAMNARYSGWGFAAFLVSNIAWIAVAAYTGQHGLLVQQAGFTVTSCIGVYRWLVRN